MASHQTTPTRRKKPYLPATCPYCSDEVEYLATPSADDQLKLACASCEKRFLVNMTTAKTTPLTLHFPPELLSIIIGLAAPPSHFDDCYTSLLALALVSRNWNELTNSILYGTIARKWDSRVAKLLMRTFDERPALLQLFRSFDTYFPNLSNWVTPISPAWKWQEEELQRLRREAAVSGRLTSGRRTTATEGGKPMLRRWRGGGHTPMRSGAIAFLDFIGRCPNLRHLYIASTSMGTMGLDEAQDYVELGARLPRQFTSLESVVCGIVDDLTIRLILDRAPKIKFVNGGYMNFDEGHEGGAPLEHLSEVVIPQLMHPSNHRGVILSRTSSALRCLSIGTRSPAVEQGLPNILPTSPLDTLILVRGLNDQLEGGEWTASLFATLLNYISSSSLSHLSLCCPTTTQLLDALPTSLVSLETAWPSKRARFNLGSVADQKPDLDQVEVIREVVKASSRLARLNKFTLRGVAEVERDALAGVVDSAAKAGLKVVLMGSFRSIA
ncbi:hypothetical protein RQP46_002176 [Phenoliferia psychrophenolica]